MVNEDEVEKFELTEGMTITPLKLRSFRFKAENADGLVENYILQELTGKKRDAYLKLIAKRMKRNPQSGKVVDVDPEGLQATILSMSCSRVLQDNSLEDVKIETFQAWGAGVLEALSDKALMLSGLNKGAREEEEKN